ncbi:MAG TPA: lysine--tRNA ligase, partial [Actinobacteria bacterium]|nr:lysine--tRNA ligase [Actinomycetota bacterium]
HNPEFTMLEAYEAYGDYTTMETLTRELIQSAARNALGGTIVRRPDGSEFDIGGEWPSRTVHEALSEAAGEEITPDTTEERLRKLAAHAEIELQPGWGRAEVLLELYEHLVEARTDGPTFYRDFPVEISPLTRQHRDDPRLAEKWDLVAFGTEIATAYSELVDPVEERARLTAQSLLAAGGDPEAMQLDEDFLRALEHGMPPSGGMGMGIDRMLIMLTGVGVRETVLFPLVKPV